MESRCERGEEIGFAGDKERKRGARGSSTCPAGSRCFLPKKKPLEQGRHSKQAALSHILSRKQSSLGDTSGDWDENFQQRDVQNSCLEWELAMKTQGKSISLSHWHEEETENISQILH